MNKWVVLVLMALAFLAGGLSFMTAKTVEPPHATPRAGGAGAQTVEVAVDASPAGSARSAKEPNFGAPNGSKARPTAGNPFGPSSKPKTAPLKGGIKAVVFSSKPDGDALTRFPQDTGQIFMTLTPSGLPDELELVASFRSTLKANEDFSPPVQSSGPPRRRSFRFTPPKGGWTSGPYQVIVKPAGSDQVLSLARFEMEKAGTAPVVTYEKPEYLDLVVDAKSVDTASLFSTEDPQVTLLVAPAEIPSNVKVRSVWSVVEVEQLTPGELVASSEVPAPGRGREARFTFSPPKGGFLPGSYRVDVYFDQQHVGSQAFFIQPAAESAAASTP